jgi:lysophospholipase L1-like esterase
MLACGSAQAATTTTTTELYMVGDSITDGMGVYVDYNRTYAHVTEDRVLGSNHDRAQTVGHSSQCLVAVDCGYPTRLLDSWGPEVVNASPTPTTVVLEIGTNDLGNGASAGDLEAGFGQLVSQASAKGIRVIVGTIPPRGVVPAWEPVRQALNTWIRATYGLNVADFDAVLTDGQGAMLTMLDEDGIHPNKYGQANMAYAVPLGQVV